MKTVPWAATCGTHCFALAPKVPFHLLDAHRRHFNPGMRTTQAPLSVKELPVSALILASWPAARHLTLLVMVMCANLQEQLPRFSWIRSWSSRVLSYINVFRGLVGRGVYTPTFLKICSVAKR